MIEDQIINSATIADYFLMKSAMTPKKVQKLVYYAYAWFIALNNQSEDEISQVLFSEKPEAWIHGPVFPSLYDKYKEYGWHEIERNKNVVTFKNKDLAKFLDRIWEIYGKKYSADELEYMTHQELPWRNARIGVAANAPCVKKIDLKDIFNYYNEAIA